MPSYRFCRTDDIPLLVDALNACFVVHFPELGPLSIEDFKREIRELDVWSSSCMVASVDGTPIAVVTGAKREQETLIHRIGVNPDFLRRGNARHLLESLGRKFSILGPPRVVAELPEDLPEVRALLEAVGYRAEQRFADFVLREPLAPPAPTAELVPASLDDLLRCDALDLTATRSWQRALPTLQNCKDQLQGLAIASDTRVLACVLFRDLPAQGRREIVALGGAAQRSDGESDARILLEIVIRAACQAGSLAVAVPRVGSEEISFASLESLGFQRMRTYTRYATQVGSTE